MPSTLKLPAVAALALFTGGVLAPRGGAPGQAPTVRAIQDTNVPVRITEWKVPWEQSRPRDPYVDARGRVWFVGQEGNYVAYLEPNSGHFEQYTIDPGTFPHNLIVAQDGMVWYSGNRNGMIGKLNPDTRAITRYPIPDSGVRDPHTLFADGKGRIFFTAQQAGYVGRLTMSSGKIDLLKLSTPGARPYGISMNSKGEVWFNEFGVNRIARLDPESMKATEFPLPDPKTRDRRIAITSDDAVWYVDYVRGYLARLDPSTGKVREFQCPGGAAAAPYALAVDDNDRLWLVETGPRPNKFVGFDSKTERFFSVTPIAESGAFAVRHMFFHKPNNEIWFGTDANTIGRAKLPPGGPKAAPKA